MLSMHSGRSADITQMCLGSPGGLGLDRCSQAGQSLARSGDYVNSDRESSTGSDSNRNSNHDSDHDLDNTSGQTLHRLLEQDII
jgi:hypothetical protein